MYIWQWGVFHHFNFDQKNDWHFVTYYDSTSMSGIDLLLLDCGHWMSKSINTTKHLSIYSLRGFISALLLSSLYDGNVLTENRGAREKWKRTKKNKRTKKSLHFSEMECDPIWRGSCVLHTVKSFRAVQPLTSFVLLCMIRSQWQPTVTQFLSLHTKFNSWHCLSEIFLWQGSINKTDVYYPR